MNIFKSYKTDVLFKNSKNIKLELNSLFSDHMVLQQKDSVTFWGKSSPLTKINVITSWGEKSLTGIE